jgi:1-acyl-sn-glycerol-3-phosphate acyltransferase
MIERMVARAERARRREPVYVGAIVVGRILFSGLLRLKPVVSGIDAIPASGAAVLAATHFGYLDFALLEWVTWLRTRRRIRYLVTKGAYDRPVVGRLLRAMGHIRVDKSAGADAYARAVEALQAGELVGIFPEAGVSASFTVRELKTGATRMAAAAGAPLIPVVIWGGQLLKTKNHRTSIREAFGAPIRVVVGTPSTLGPTDDPIEATLRLRSQLQVLLDEAQASYPRSGMGEWWQPVHLGGTAPAPEEAAVWEAERQARKEAEHG